MNNENSCDKIVLLAKRPGLTSFSSLFTIKHALNTQKVGHTGTLDSFAQGLLVVCCGALTRIAGRITEFDKTYEAVIQFGSETDTLECTGKVMESAPLPEEKDFIRAVEKFRGKIMQRPPAFSAIHVNGKRASDEMRSGKSVEIPERPVTVYSSEILEVKKTENGLISAARVNFKVSKGTYIRSLARDIARECGSRGFLAGLYRKSVGNFKIENAAGFDTLEDFTIDSALNNAEKLVAAEKKRLETEQLLQSEGIARKFWKSDPRWKEFERDVHSKEEVALQTEIRKKACSFDRETALECGFDSIILKNASGKWFRNGGKLSSAMFTVSPFEKQNEYLAVFSENSDFAGLLKKNDSGYYCYEFVNGGFIPEE